MRTGYVSDELMVIYHTPHESDTEPERNFRDIFAQTKYVLFYVIKGTARAQNGTYICDVGKNQLMIVDTHMAFGYRFPNQNDYKCLYIEMHPGLFTNQADDNNFMRAFEHIKPYDSVIDCDTQETEFIKHIMNSIVECNLLQLGKSHIMPRINSVISQLCIYYDKKYKNEKVATDSVSVKIINYIHRNYLNKITYETLSEKFFVSKPIINEILHNFTGHTLREYIEILRLREAEKMLGENFKIHKIAELCGFSTYSTFYRAYKRVYGYPPSNKQKGRIKNWALSK